MTAYERKVDQLNQARKSYKSLIIKGDEKRAEKYLQKVIAIDREIKDMELEMGIRSDCRRGDYPRPEERNVGNYPKQPSKIKKAWKTIRNFYERCP